MEPPVPEREREEPARVPDEAREPDRPPEDEPEPPEREEERPEPREEPEAELELDPLEDEPRREVDFLRPRAPLLEP